MAQANEFKCTECPKSYDREDLLYPHYLFEHGIYKQTCSTDVALKQYERQQDLLSRYDLLRRELLSVVRKLQPSKKQKWYDPQKYNEKKHYYITRELKTLIQELDSLGAIYSKIHFTLFNFDYKQFDPSRPHECNKCSHGVHLFRLDKSIRACNNSVTISYGGQRYRFPCSCECNENHSEKRKKCPLCDLVSFSGPLQTHLISNFKKNLKWD